MHSSLCVKITLLLDISHKCGTFLYLDVNLYVPRISLEVGGTAVFNCPSPENTTFSCLGKPCHVSFKICSHLEHPRSQMFVPSLFNFSSQDVWRSMQVVIYTPGERTVTQIEGEVFHLVLVTTGGNGKHISL